MHRISNLISFSQPSSPARAKLSPNARTSLYKYRKDLEYYKERPQFANITSSPFRKYAEKSSNKLKFVTEDLIDNIKVPKFVYLIFYRKNTLTILKKAERHLKIRY